MLNIDLSNRSILITGGLGAIARSVVERLAQAGAHLIITDIISEDAAKNQLVEYGMPADQWIYLRCDVTDSNVVGPVFKSIFDSELRPDSMIGLAGGCELHPFATTPIESYRTIFNYNYFGQVLPTKEITDLWAQFGIRGHVILTSSLVGSLPWSDLSAYASAKAAIEQFSKCLALEFAPLGIRFNCVAPGHVATGSSRKVYDTDPNYRALVDRVIPLRRLVRPQAIADAFTWLCSPMADDVNGQIVHVDCGASIPKVG